MHKHVFNAKAFKAQRLPLLLLVMLPSFLADGYLIYGLIAQLHTFPLPPQTGSFWDAAAPFAINFVFLKAPLMLRYSRVRQMRLGSYVTVLEAQIVYRISKFGLFSKPESGYACHDDYYFKEITAVRRKRSGAIIVTGAIKAVRKQHGFEAVMRERQLKHMVIPGYYEDMSGIEGKLKALIK